MTITRSGLHSEISLLDEQIDALNKDKANCFKAYRQQMEAEKRSGGEISAEIKACKKAFKLKRALTKNRAAIEQQDALVDEILSEIELGTRRATRATRETKSQSAPVNATSRTPDRTSGADAESQVPQPVGASAINSVSFESAASETAARSPDLSSGERTDEAKAPTSLRLDGGLPATASAVVGRDAETVMGSERSSLARSQAGEGRKATNATALSAPQVATAGDRGDGGTAATVIGMEDVRTTFLNRVIA